VRRLVVGMDEREPKSVVIFPLDRNVYGIALRALAERKQLQRGLAADHEQKDVLDNVGGTTYSSARKLKHVN
jgi:hypothetical protein